MNSHMFLAAFTHSVFLQVLNKYVWSDKTKNQIKNSFAVYKRM